MNVPKGKKVSKMEHNRQTAGLPTSRKRTAAEEPARHCSRARRSFVDRTSPREKGAPTVQHNHENGHMHSNRKMTASDEPQSDVEFPPLSYFVTFCSTTIRTEKCTRTEK